MDIIPLKKEQLNVVVELSNKAFGNDYLNQSFFLSSSKSTWVALIENKVIGFITLTKSSKNELDQHLLKGAEQILSFLKTDKIAIIGQVVVDANYQKKGIGTQLLQHSLEQLPYQEYLCVAWKKTNTTPMAKLLSNCNFQFIKTFPHYWTEDSKKRKYNCPICGNPCRCGAEIYVKRQH